MDRKWRYHRQVVDTHIPGQAPDHTELNMAFESMGQAGWELVNAQQFYWQSREPPAWVVLFWKQEITSQQPDRASHDPAVRA